MERQPAQDPPSLLLRVLEDTGRQRCHPHLLDGQSALLQAGQPRRIRGEDLFDDFELLFHDGKLALFGGVHLGDGDDGLPGGRNDDVAGGAGGLVEDEGAETAIHLGGGPIRAAHGIEQADVGHARGVGELPGRAQHRGDGPDLGLGRQGEGGGCGRLGDGSGRMAGHYAPLQSGPVG